MLDEDEPYTKLSFRDHQLLDGDGLQLIKRNLDPDRSLDEENWLERRSWGTGDLKITELIDQLRIQPQKLRSLESNQWIAIDISKSNPQSYARSNNFFETDISD